jgi:hypothetical protein
MLDRSYLASSRIRWTGFVFSWKEPLNHWRDRIGRGDAVTLIRAIPMQHRLRCAKKCYARGVLQELPQPGRRNWHRRPLLEKTSAHGGKKARLKPVTRQGRATWHQCRPAVQVAPLAAGQGVGQRCSLWIERCSGADIHPIKVTEEAAPAGTVADVFLEGRQGSSSRAASGCVTKSLPMLLPSCTSSNHLRAEAHMIVFLPVVRVWLATARKKAAVISPIALEAVKGHCRAVRHRAAISGPRAARSPSMASHASVRQPERGDSGRNIAENLPELVACRG